MYCTVHTYSVWPVLSLRTEYDVSRRELVSRIVTHFLLPQIPRVMMACIWSIIPCLSWSLLCLISYELEDFSPAHNCDGFRSGTLLMSLQTIGWLCMTLEPWQKSVGILLCATAASHCHLTCAGGAWPEGWKGFPRLGWNQSLQRINVSTVQLTPILDVLKVDRGKESTEHLNNKKKKKKRFRQ